MDILESIGNTPLVQLKRIVPSGSGRVFVKLEKANPTGSMKDRMARAVIEAAERKGQLSSGGTVVEYTGGTTGISLAFVCAAKGYRTEIVFSDAFSMEKAFTMRAFGANVTIVHNDGRGITENTIRLMIEKAREMSKLPGSWWSDQLNNRDAARGYHALGEEIWNQTNGAIDAFVQSVGTAHSIHGTTEVLSAYKSSIQAAAVEPAISRAFGQVPWVSHHRGNRHRVCPPTLAEGQSERSDDSLYARGGTDGAAPGSRRRDIWRNVIGGKRICSLEGRQTIRAESDSCYANC